MRLVSVRFAVTTIPRGKDGPVTFTLAATLAGRPVMATRRSPSFAVALGLAVVAASEVGSAVAGVTTDSAASTTIPAVSSDNRGRISPLLGIRRTVTRDRGCGRFLCHPSNMRLCLETPA